VIFKQFFRLAHILWVWTKYDLNAVVFRVPALKWLKFLIVFNPFAWGVSKRHTPGERLRLALQELGPIFIKFGQVVSTRRDILSDDIANALAKLQDQVPPFDGKIAQANIEEALGDTVENIFADFNPEPLAAASIAQVHAAELKTGEKVVVKVLRPGIQNAIAKDIAVLTFLAKTLECIMPKSRRLHPVEVVTEMNRILQDELDLVKEAANASQLKRNFEGSDLIYVPAVYFDYCTTGVMVQERLEGLRSSDIEGLKACGANLKLLAERGVETFYTQVFRDCFFHADMHPGNVFIDVTNPADPRFMAVDFGIMGSLDDADKHYLACNFIAFFNRDYREVARLHIESGWVDASTRIGDFESAIRSVCEPIFNKPLSEISYAETLLRLFQIAKRYNMEVQPQLLLLQKTLLNIEGMGREMYPELDLWNTAKPFLERWMKTQVGPRAFLNNLKKEWPSLQNTLPRLPRLLDECVALQKAQATHMKKPARTPWGKVALAFVVGVVVAVVGSYFYCG
jgi:ubiquinone biosynthesis protein